LKPCGYQQAAKFVDVIVTLTGTDCSFPSHLLLPDGFQGVDGGLEFLLDALPPRCRWLLNADSKPLHVGHIGTPAPGREHAIVKRNVSIDGARKDHARPEQIGSYDANVAVGDLEAMTELLREND